MQISRLFRILLFLSSCSFAAFTALLIFLLYGYLPPLTLVPREKQHTVPVAVLDREGGLLFYLYGTPHETVSYASLPPHVIHAFLAAEDHRFFEHRGISYRSIIRSIIINILKRSFAQGASTITQQTIKLTSGKRKKNLARKIQEQITALVVESHYSKEQILESYLNIAYFGSGIYGIQAAARTFWGIPATELSVEQAAALAGIVQRPEYYCPLTYPENCAKRRTSILQKMVHAGFITPDYAEKASAAPLVVQRKYLSPEYEYLRASIQDFFERIISRDRLRPLGPASSYFIFTTLDRSIQRKVIQQAHQSLLNLQEKAPDIEGGGVVLDTKTGELLAFFPGFHPHSSTFNRALEAKKQIGSLIKPLVAYYAFTKGDSPTTIYQDEPLTLANNWKPGNYHGKFEGPLTIAQALIRSNNIVPIKLLMHHNPSDFALLIEQTHLATKVPPYLSLALGCIDSSPYQIAAYFRLFAHDGVYREPHFIKKIVNQNHESFYKAHTKEHACLSKKALGETRGILEGAAQALSKRLGRKNSFPLIAKTGTTNGIRTCWCAAATPRYTITFYLGYDNNKSMLELPVRSGLTVAPLCFDILHEICTDHGNFAE